MEECFVVRYISVRNCFAYLPITYLRKLSTKRNVIKISNKVGDYYLSYHSRPSHDNSLCLNATFATSLSIREGDTVIVSYASYPDPLNSMVVIPQCPQDWEIVELQSYKIQSIVLDQVTVVSQNQPIIVWISKFLYVTLIVDSLNPDFKYGKLEQFTEVVVMQETADICNKRASQSCNTCIDFTMWNIFKVFLPSASKKGTVLKERSISERTRQFLRKYAKESTEVFRVNVLPSEKNFGSRNVFNFVVEQPYHVFVHRHHFPKDFTGSREPGNAFYKIKKVQESNQGSETKSTIIPDLHELYTIQEPSDFVVKLFVIEDVFEKCSIEMNVGYFANESTHKSVYMSDNLRINLNVVIGSKVTLKCLEFVEHNASCIDIFPFEKSVTQEMFKNYVYRRSKHDKILLNSWGFVDFNEGACCILRILPEQCSYVLLNEISLRNVTIRVHDVIPNTYNRRTDSYTTGRNCLNNISIRSVHSIILKCQTILSLGLNLHNISSLQCDRENILICGNVGAGKTTICEMIKASLEKAPYFIHTYFVDCNSLKGKKMDALQKFFLSALSKCIYYQPSVLFLDNIESIASLILYEEENTSGVVNTDRVADMLLNLITKYQSSYCIALVATCINVNNISRQFWAPKGMHLFGSILTIPHLKKEDRIGVLEVALKTKFGVSTNMSWNYYGNKTEGWMVQDLVDAAEKAAFVAWKRHVKSSSKSPLILLGDDVSHSLDYFTPVSLHGIRTYKGNASHNWSNIGGLNDVKRSLIEFLYWPVKHADLFKNAPIRHQIGILLYGMPGTGKTILLGAVAKECGLNLISVKGPELLSKYVGSSEEAVRIIFEKACCAKPCILFFDEFESFAPRRGYEYTDVTDRVVNQLLTQLDGIEEREGIIVVAASSRPDLIDPALLRPGRLDKHLLCSLPNENDREEIISALCKVHNVNNDSLDLKALAAMTSGCTGADLNAAFLQAKLTVSEETLAASLVNQESDFDEVQIFQTHLINSLGSLHLSLPSATTARYETIYSRFIKEDKFPEALKHQKATLA